MGLAAELGAVAGAQIRRVTREQRRLREEQRRHQASEQRLRIAGDGLLSPGSPAG